MTSAAENIVGLYQKHARSWARARGDRLIEGAWLDRFRELSPAGGRVLDIGCGSGEPIVRALVARGCRVSGVDAAPAMIAMCEARFPGQDWRVADMRGLSLRRVFDGIIAWDSFFHLCPDDQRKMFPIFRAHAAPRAVLMFTSGPAHGAAFGVLEGEPLYHASLDGSEYRALLDGHGFEVLVHAVDDPVAGLHTVWLARFR